jgi:hypothetical protein
VGLGAAAVDEGPGTVPAEASWPARAASLARTCAESVAWWYFVPLVVTAKEAELLPASGSRAPAADCGASGPAAALAAALDAADAGAGAALEKVDSVVWLCAMA